MARQSKNEDCKMLKYNISASGNARWHNCQRAMISISQGNRNLAGDKFEALLSWAYTRFQEIIINVSDTLSRHNLIADGYSEPLAESMSERHGNIWLKEHHHIIKPHNDKIIAIHRWNDWRRHSSYDEISNQIHKFYLDDTGLTKAVNDDCEMFLLRKIEQGYENIEHHRTCSRNYLLEELAAYTIIGRQYQANRIYPAKDLKCFEYMRSSCSIPLSLKGLELTTHIHASFKKKGSVFTGHSNDNQGRE